MDVSSFFSRKAPAAAPAAKPAAPTPFDPLTGKPTEGYKAPPGSPASKGADANDPENGESPLDVYSKMFNNKAGGEAANTPPPFQLDPAGVKKVSSSLKFSDHVTPEAFAALGFSGDINQFKELLDGVGRQAYEHSLSHGAHLTENWTGARLAHEQKNLGSQVRGLQDKDSLSALAAKNPVAKAHLEKIGSEVRAIFPDASPAEVAQHTKDYIKALAMTVDPSLGAAPKEIDPMTGQPRAPAGGDFDWMGEFFDPSGKAPQQGGLG